MTRPLIHTVLIDQEFRNQGLGSYLMKGAEEYMRKRGIKNVYLMTKGQEDFYEKNGYRACKPDDVVNCIDFATDPVVKAAMTEMAENESSCSKSEDDLEPTCNDLDIPPPPPPPPMPNFAMVPNFIFNSRTFMLKKLE